MRTVLAVVAAAAMIAAAVLFRLDGGAGPALLGEQEPVRLVCIPELRAVCEAVAERGVTTRVEEAGQTAARLSGSGPVTDDAWVTFAPWRDIVIDARRRGSLPPLPELGTDVLARSPLVLVAWAERAAVLEQACRGGLRWRCIGARAGDGWADLGGHAAWGPFKPTLPDPTTNATGLLVLGQAAADFLGGTDFSTRDMDDDAFLGWLSQLQRGSVPTAGAPVAQMLTLGPAAVDVTGTTEAEALTRMRGAARAGELTVTYPEPVSVAEVVLAPLDAGGFDRALEAVEGDGVTALVQAGWRVAGRPSDGADGPELPPHAQLPSAGVLDALRARVEEIR